MAIKLTSNSNGLTGHLGIGSEIALTVNSVNCVVVSNAISSAALDGSLATNIVPISGLDVNCASGIFFTKTINGASAFTVSSVPSGRAYSFTLELTQTSGAVTWFTGVEWPGGVAPSLTAGKTHLFMFVTDDGGTRWRGSALTNYTN